MLAILAMCFPPLLLVFVRNRTLNIHMSKENNVIFYLISTLGLNLLMMLILDIIFQNRSNLFNSLNTYFDFTCKYIALSCFIALVEPFVERFIKEHFHFNFSIPHAIKSFKYWRLCAIIFSIVLFLLNFIRIFDNNLWGDEAFTANLCNYSVLEIIYKTSTDVHPPLYYLFVRMAYMIFGRQGWAYHLVSLIPCAIIIVFALTAIWKKFGKESAIILITLQCLSANAIEYNVEVRMYSWGGLFILLSFYYFCSILESNKTKNYVLFVLFSLAAAYTHYYCLLSVAFFYMMLLILALFKRNITLKRVIQIYVVTIIGYLPWFFIMIKGMLSFTGSNWVTSIPSFFGSLNYLFSSQFPQWLVIVLAIALVFAIGYETSVVTIQQDKDESFPIALNFKKMQLSNYTIILITGGLSVVGTIVTGIVVSKLMSPLYVLRYIYPVSVIAWLLLGIVISRLKGRKIYATLLVLYMITIFLPAYQNIYANEKSANDKLTSTLMATKEIESGNVILTNHPHIDWTIAHYYYPGVETQLVTLPDIPDLKNNKTYWLIISGNQEMNEVFEQLNQQNYTFEKIVTDGNLGTHTVFVYKLNYVPERIN